MIRTANPTREPMLDMHNELPYMAHGTSPAMDELDEQIARDIASLVVEYNMAQSKYPSEIGKKLAVRALKKLKRSGISHELNVKLLMDKFLAQKGRDPMTGEVILPGTAELRPFLSTSGYTYRNTAWFNSGTSLSVEWILEHVKKGAV